jgi:GcrA cell cycle regulator
MGHVTLWTEAQSNQLRELWATTLSASAIGRIMGFTRNAIIGRAHRLKLARRSRTGGRPNKSGKVYRKRLIGPRLIVQRRIPQVVYTPPDEPQSLNLTLMQLEPGQCRWPHGEGPVFFCGAATHEASSYCEHHNHRSKNHDKRSRVCEPQFKTWKYPEMAA